ncbi:LOW QUALITY PROTEIN: PR domain zinc finger protein 2 [Silurus meridionalis]|uniref:LOW QUALITY PROTEIN: PR domain zinc finger protein 2 n=1 Tax=Silurus meridionalis TaxID=175797 RepID=UPI001EEA98F7|nr:LOW QUALITY PROTEIN: PR domain zinc finger protein 2 [Silurus meridionalis]
MGDYENVKAEELLVSSEEQQQYVILPCPTDSHQHCLTGESPLLNDSMNEKKRKAEGGTDDMMEQTDEDQTILPAQRTSMPTMEPVPLQTTDEINQNVPCKTGETEFMEMLKQDNKLDFPTSEADADQDPDCDRKINPDGNHQGSRMFFCQHCQRRFTTKQGLERHMHAMSSCHQQIFKCRFCRKCFSTQFCRRRHERRHNNGNRRTGGLIISPAPQVVHETQGIVSLEKEDELSLTSQVVSNFPVPDLEVKDDSDEFRETKCLFVCKYCKKSFGTHTSLRRHERRIHERRLLPRGACQKVVNSHEVKIQSSGGGPETSSNAQQHSNEVRQEEEYMVDISGNISENLSFYIDGKIISTSAVTNCEVMELNSAAAVIGLDALIVNPAQITQAFKIESNDCSMTSDLSGQSSSRRRTSTPPLLPQIKTELESESILTTPSSTSESTLIGTVFPRTLETIVLQKEKTIYLSPKLKQLLQNQDSSKSSFSLITEGQKLCPPLPLTLLPATSSRFKRRTSSPPPNCPQQSSASMLKSSVEQETDSSAPKMPKIDSHCTSAMSLSKKEEMGTVNLAPNNNETSQELLDCSASGTGGRSCNQQPLDLSSAVGKRESEILADCVLDLSMNRKSTESDSAGCFALQTSVRKTKPNSSMLEKVLLNQYAVVDVSAPADGIISAPTATDLAAIAVSEPVLENHENVVLEQAPPSTPSLNATPSLPNSATLNTSSAKPILTTQEPTEIFLPAQTSITNQELHPICSTAQSSSPVVLSGPVELSVGSSLAAFNVSLPNWLNTAPGSVTHALIPTTPTLSLQSPQFLTDASVCDLAQRTLVIDSVLSPETQLISPVLVNQSNISSLSFSPNVVVIEYTVALESSNATPFPQANAVDSDFDKTSPDHTDTQKPQPSQLKTSNTEPSVPELPETGTVEAQDEASDSSSIEGSLENDAVLPLLGSSVSQNVETTVELAENASSTENFKVEISDLSIQHNPLNDEIALPPLCKRFMCNACDELFQSMKGLSQHIGEHSDTWPYKCEFCVQLFETDTDLFEHRSSYHGIGKIYVCRICSKEFAFLCNLEQHHRDLHPGQECSHTEVENGKLRPENHNSPVRSDTVTTECPSIDKCGPSFETALKPEPGNISENTTEELYTTIKIMASEGVKPKGTDVRLGINQHYPSFKPPPFPYHNRTPVEPTTTATNFTTHNIPQTFSTTVRCTKCGRGFDNMPELHKHILACANASDKKRYTPKKNPIPLKQFAKVQNGVLLPARGVNLRQNVSQKLPKKPQCHESEAKTKLGSHSKRKSMWIQRGRPVGRKSSQEELEVYVCPHCSREFTYHTSLKKHMAFSCPMKPICRKPPKRKGSMAPTQENHGRVHTRVSEVIMKPQRLNQGQKSLAKTQPNEPGSASSVNLPVKAHIGKGKFTVRNYRPKTSDILSSSADHISKKSRLILMETIQSPIASKSLVALGKSQQQSNGVHCLESKIKQRDIELKPSTEEQFSLRVRGPITRSLQHVSSNVTSNTNKKANSTNPTKSFVQTGDQNVTHQAVVESKKLN